MSKFTSLSTSLLLAFLTSSFAASAYANKSEPQTELVGSASKSFDSSSKVDIAEQLDLRHAPSLNDLDGMSSSKSNLTGSLADNLSSVQMERTEYSLNLDPSSKSQDKQVKFSIEHPTSLKESFIVAANKSFVSFTNEQGNLIIGVKVESLDPQVRKSLTLESLKEDVTKRFSDKEHMLYGEYDLISQIEEPETGLVDLTIKAFLKKSADGILPDMQSFFYERNIVIKDYIVTITTTVQGTQAQATLSKDVFNNLSEVLLRVVNSYQSPDLIVYK